MSDIDGLIVDFAKRLRSTDVLPILHEPYSVTPRQQVAVEREHAPAPDVRKLSGEEYDSVQALLSVAASEALKAIRRFGRSAQDMAILSAFRSVVVEQCSAIIEAANTRIKVGKLVKKENARLDDVREKARKVLADDLRQARKHLRKLKQRTDFAEQEAEKRVQEHFVIRRKALAQRLKSARSRLLATNAHIQDRWRAAMHVSTVGQDCLYPAVPLPTVLPHKEGAGMPDAPGIYFLWKDDDIVYVGQSRRLCGRVKLGAHHILQPDHEISYVMLAAHELTWAECYYIGTVKPRENFGGRPAKLSAAIE